MKNVDMRAMRDHADKASQLLKALSHPGRLQILCALIEGESSVGSLNERIDMSQSSLSQHLAVLREQGLVYTRRDAQTIYYSLASTNAKLLIECLHGIYCK